MAIRQAACKGGDFYDALVGDGASLFGRSQQHDRDALIAAAQVGIAFQLRLRLQKTPGRVIGLRPVLSKNAPANLPGLDQIVQAPLHRNADVTARPRRAVSVNNFQQRMFLLASYGDLTVQPLQRLRHRRHIRLKIYGFDGVPSDSWPYHSRDIVAIC